MIFLYKYHLTKANIHLSFQIIYKVDLNIIRMETLKKAKLNNFDEQTNIDKCRIAANITEYRIVLNQTS